MSGLQELVRANNESIRRMQQISAVLCEWFDHEYSQIQRQFPQRHGGLLMGAPVWGADYIRRMALYSLPTLGSDRNIRALGDGRCWLVIYGAAAERPTIWKLTRWLRRMGVRTLLRDIPDELIALAQQTPDDRYGLLASTQNVLAHMAGHAGMGFHMYMPDHMYSDGYFERLDELRRDHSAIVQQGLSINAATAPVAIERYRDPSGALAIPARDMGGIVLDHMHPRSSMLMMNGAPPGKLPDSRQVSWRGRNTISIADSCHLLSYVSPELCLDAPVAFTSTLDMLAPEYIPPGAWHMVNPDDDMAYCEISDASRIAPPDYVDMDRWQLRAWAQVAFTDDYMEYFSTLCRISIPEQQEGDYIPDEEIARHHQSLIQAMRDGEHMAMKTYFASQHPSRWV